MKVVDQETGEDITEKLKAERDAEKTRERNRDGE
jgi:polyribonucleotide nucleotidyltransferase